MPESELLEASCRDEKEEIEKRNNSKVIWKDSAVYKCKFCKSAKVTIE